MSIVFRKARSAVTRATSFVRSQRFGADPARIYHQSFYNDGGFEKTDHSARVISDWACRSLAPGSLLDLGSGAGHYLRAFAHRGVRVFGLEASPTGVAASGDGVLAMNYDLKKPLFLSTRFDIVMCVEVAEHIPKRYSETLVKSICRHASKYIIFTAAPPGTLGLDHINCQPEDFWKRMFERQGFGLRTDLTTELRSVATEEETADWWKSWAWCFERTPPAS